MTIESFLRMLVGNGGDCIEWRGAVNADGYGVLRSPQELRRDEGMPALVYAHRLAYRLFRSPIEPEGTIDHLCRNKVCCNPYHLEVVSRSENTMRGNAARLRPADASWEF